MLISRPFLPQSLHLSICLSVKSTLLNTQSSIFNQLIKDLATLLNKDLEYHPYSKQKCHLNSNISRPRRF